MSQEISLTSEKITAIHKAIDRVANQIELIEHKLDRSVDFRIYLSKPYLTPKHDYAVCASATIKISIHDHGEG